MVAAVAQLPEAVTRRAARLTFWRAGGGAIDIARIGQSAGAVGYRFRRGAVDLTTCSTERRVASAAWAAVDCGRRMATPSTAAFRSRRARLNDLWAAFAAQSGRPGNGDRRRVLIDSRDEPWSAAERVGHRILRGHGIVGWKANHDIIVEGNLYWIDIAFLAVKLAVEIDGRLHEDDPEIFRTIAAERPGEAGWMVLRFTYAMLVNDPQYVVDAILAAHSAAIRRSVPAMTFEARNPGSAPNGGTDLRILRACGASRGGGAGWPSRR